MIARPLVVATWLLAALAAQPARADFATGVAAYDRGDYAAAYEAWLPLAGGGDPAAQRNIGHLYRFGFGVAQDFALAVNWYRQAAEAGLAGAQANLAVMYLRGQGVAEAPEQAAYWFQLAAVQGHAVAQYNLGLLHLKGIGVARDEGRALGWFNLAAKHGHPQALDALSKLVMASAYQVGPPPPPGFVGGHNAGVPPSPAPAAEPSHAREEMPERQSQAGPGAPAQATGTPAPPQPGDGLVRAPATPPVPAAPAAAVVAAVPAAYAIRPGDEERLRRAVVAYLAGDYGRAREALLTLAEAGMAEAEYQLGMLLVEPDYDRADRAEAYVWLTLANEHGHPDAERVRRRLIPLLTNEEGNRSQRLLLARRGRS
jgi:hypothetical protein